MRICEFQYPAERKEIIWIARYAVSFTMIRPAQVTWPLAAAVVCLGGNAPVLLFVDFFLWTGTRGMRMECNWSFMLFFWKLMSVRWNDPCDRCLVRQLFV